MEKKKKITPEYIMKCEVAKEIGLWDKIEKLVCHFLLKSDFSSKIILFVFYMNFRYAFKTFKWAVDKGKASISSKVYIPSISCSKTK